jgi:hypothetical protein
MLIVNPKKRVSAAHALESHWVEKGDPEVEKRQIEEVKRKNLTAGKQKLKQAMKNVRTLTVLACSLSSPSRFD